MGQKVHPIYQRLGGVSQHRSVWYADTKDYAALVKSDIEIRRFLKKLLSKAQVGAIRIERLAGKTVKVIIETARAGIIIGRKGEDIEKLKKQVSDFVGMPVHISIEEIRRPELNAQLVAENIAQQLENRVMFRRAMKRSVSSAMRLGAEGVKICVGGRLGGAEIARKEWVREGRVPLHTLRANIDYGFAEAKTTYCIIGVKVWIFKGEIFAQDDSAVAKEESKG